jgi:hypothetical protein
MLTFENANSTDTPAWHAGFLAMLPEIRDQLRFAFRGFSPEARHDAVEESVALVVAAYARLHQQGRADIAYPTVLAMYAARHYRAGRRVGGHLNRNDVMSPYAQRHHGIVLERLDRRDPAGDWKEVLVEARGVTPAETAAARIDFADWLGRLCRRDRGVATTLATGETGRETAKLFGLTAGRISQLRSELKRNWQAFQGEPADEAGELALAGC